MPRPLVATISITAMQHNLELARAAAPQRMLWATVKANAYGHGLERALRGFVAADGLALVEPEAAAMLRELGWRKPILLLEGGFDAMDYRLAALHHFDLTIHCEAQIALLEQTRFTEPVTIFLKMNSGMNRLGFLPTAYADAYRRLRAMSSVGKIICMTHFANADNPANPALPMAEQLHRFQTGVAGLSDAWSLANSGALLLHPELPAGDLRPGIMLYGGSPGARSATEFGLQPAMLLQSALISIQYISAGEAVGYGSRFIAPGPMAVGVVACGYADGYPRHAPLGTPVLVDGVRTRLIGNVSMDMLTVDLSPVPTAHIGSPVTLWGGDLPVDEVASAAGTIGYELLCALAPRVRVIEHA